MMFVSVRLSAQLLNDLGKNGNFKTTRRIGDRRMAWAA